MKIFLLASAEKIHMHRWATWLAHRGYSVTMLSDKPAPPAFDYGRVHIVPPHWTLWRNFLVYKVKGGPYANNAEKWRAYEDIIIEGDPDILHASEALAYGPTLAHFPQYTRVLTPWGPDMEKLADPATPEEARSLIKLACQSADILTTNAPGLEAHWAKLADIPIERFHNFSWGTDTQIFAPVSEPQQRAIRAMLNLPQRERLVLSPRLAKPYYRIDVLMEGWHRAGLGNAALVVLRAGADDESWAALKRLADSLAPSSIHLVDKLLKPTEMAALYSTCSAMAMLPQTDLVASSLLEGLACGCLPLLANLPCYRHAVADLGEEPSAKPRAQGLYLREATPEGIADGLLRWDAIPAQRLAAVRDANIAHVREHESWERCAEQMEEAYLLAQRNFVARMRHTS